MKDWKQFAIAFFTLAITFIIPVTLTRVIQENPEDVRTQAQEITANAAAIVDTGVENLSKTPTINVPILGEMQIATLGLYVAAVVFLIVMIVAGTKLFKPVKKVF